MSAERYDTLHVAGGRDVKMWTRGVPLDPKAKAQLANTARMPFVFRHLAAMPDVHVGIGATVGSVVATKGAIIPAAVGVDIGCGMIAQQTTLTASDLPDSLGKIRSGIERAVPHGFVTTPGRSLKGAWIAPPNSVATRWRGLAGRLEPIVENYPRLQQKSPQSQLGTHGGGNHFIEVCLDEADRVWVMLHSGSRGIGNAIGTYFIELARRDAERHELRLPDRDLAYFAEGAQHFDDYVEAVGWAQDYARANRAEMLELVLAALARHLPAFAVTDEAVNCHHNYVAAETHYGARVWVTRKGAIRAGAGDLGIIPGSMGARSYIVRGRGSAESFHSCAHGAGRRMSRNAAKRRFSPGDLETQTAGVICRKDQGVIDEIPGAYKDIDEVMANQADLVEVLHTLKQVVCVKG
jgi:tRNA-splicing ligase RtcB